MGASGAGGGRTHRISTAVAMLGLHRLRRIDTRAVVAHFAGVASLVSLAWLLLRRHDLRPIALDATTLLMLLGVGVSGTFGQVCLTKAYASGPPGRVSVVGLSQVVFGMAFDVALWGRSLTPATLAGFALVLTLTAWLIARPAGRR